MINWLKNMYRKQKESDKLLETMFVDRKEEHRKKIISFVKEMIISIEEYKKRYNITEEDLI